MLDSVHDIYGGAFSENEGVNESANEIPKNEGVKNSEGIEYSEADLERIEPTAEIMGEIFTDEVISNWENLSVGERTAYLDEYYAEAGQAMGIDTKGVYVADLYAEYGYGTQGVNCGDGYLGIDIRLVADSSQLGELLNTTTHEMRHQFQTDALKNPDAFPDIPQETLDQWEYEFTNYVDPSYDFEGYQNQAIESDARAFAEEVVDEYLSDAKHDTPVVAKYESEIPADVVTDGENASAGIEVMSTPADFNPDHVEASEGINELSDAPAEGAAVDGLEVDKDLNKTPLFYTAGQCAKISTGTQNYCPFAGSGR